ncbi:MAG: GFA family protein [Deltaproteobacteria bacterium]|nr:GFA family protein [Deltaproteobacteria bacterium]
MLHGGCLCSGVRYEIDSSVEDMTNCHCGMCRKAHGAAYATFVTVQGKSFRYTQGEELVETYQSSPELGRAFCRVCGSSLAVIEPKTAEVFVAAGTLDEDPGIRPESHIFVGSKAPWLDIHDDTPSFDAYPPEEG